MPTASSRRLRYYFPMPYGAGAGNRDGKLQWDDVQHIRRKLANSSSRPEYEFWRVGVGTLRTPYVIQYPRLPQIVFDHPAQAHTRTEYCTENHIVVRTHRRHSSISQDTMSTNLCSICKLRIYLRTSQFQYNRRNSDPRSLSSADRDLPKLAQSTAD
jgi:hypothetical protein